MLTLILISFLAGIFTVITPCVLPVLPIILGTSIVEGKLKRIIVIISSFAFSILFFTLLLKVTTLFIGINTRFLSIFAGTIITFYGIILIYKNLWHKINTFLKLSNLNLSGKFNKGGIIGNILIGLSLGPIFSSCSPTYTLIVAIVLPENFSIGIIYLTSYIFGLSLILFLISYFGINFIKKISKKVSSNKISKIIGIILFIVGILIIFGIDKQIETILVNSDFFDKFINFESNFLEKYR
ncbi:MAG: cytochrome c biogenesis protein CcdA [Candidatus Gracilibacteria bacterium]